MFRIDNYGAIWYNYNIRLVRENDFVAIANEYGNMAAEYTYDAWGCVLYTNEYTHNNIGYVNPFRYRGYYYDVELGFYYLNSRYYDPALGRFINADDVSLLGANGDFASLNLYAYCGNNPIARADDGGKFWNVVIGAVVGGFISAAVSAAISYAQTGEIDWGAVAINAAVGGISGAIAATGLGAFSQAGLTAIVSGAGNYVEQVYTEGFDNVNGADVIGSFALGAVTSLLGSGAGEIIGKPIKNIGKGILGKAQDKFLTGMVRETLGQSHSAYFRQGAKYLAQSTKVFNIFRGISSSVGSVIGGATSSAYSAFKTCILGW